MWQTVHEKNNRVGTKGIGQGGGRPGKKNGFSTVSGPWASPGGREPDWKKTKGGASHLPRPDSLATGGPRALGTGIRTEGKRFSRFKMWGVCWWGGRASWFQTAKILGLGLNLGGIFPSPRGGRLQGKRGFSRVFVLVGRGPGPGGGNGPSTVGGGRIKIPGRERFQGKKLGGFFWAILNHGGKRELLKGGGADCPGAGGPLTQSGSGCGIHLLWGKFLRGGGPGTSKGGGGARNRHSAEEFRGPGAWGAWNRDF